MQACITILARDLGRAIFLPAVPPGLAVHGGGVGSLCSFSSWAWAVRGNPCSPSLLLKLGCQLHCLIRPLLSFLETRFVVRVKIHQRLWLSPTTWLVEQSSWVTISNGQPTQISFNLGTFTFTYTFISGAENCSLHLHHSDAGVFSYLSPRRKGALSPAQEAEGEVHYKSRIKQRTGLDCHWWHFETYQQGMLPLLKMRGAVSLGWPLYRSFQPQCDNGHINGNVE